VFRRCPAGHWHRVSAEEPECGHTGRILDWCEEWQRWIPNPTKDAVAKQQFEESDEFEIEREARLRLEEDIRKGKITAKEDIRRKIMNIKGR
jgi:hypothetical protein